MIQANLVNLWTASLMLPDSPLKPSFRAILGPTRLPENPLITASLPLLGANYGAI
jgi:hypothetical protein